MQKFIKFTIEQMLGVYLHFSNHSTYMLNYFLQKNLIGYYMNLNIFNLNTSLYSIRSGVNLIYYFMRQWRWRPIVLIPALVLKLQLIDILNKLKISYISGKWLGGYLTNFKKLFLVKDNKHNSWFKFMPRFCIIIGSFKGGESALKESRALSLFTFLFSDTYSTPPSACENFVYLIPVGTSLVRSRLFLIWLLVDLYRKLVATRSRLFWCKVKNFVKKDGFSILKHINRKKTLFVGCCDFLLKKYFTSRNLFKIWNRQRRKLCQLEQGLRYGKKFNYLNIHNSKRVAVKFRTLPQRLNNNTYYILDWLSGALLANKEVSINVDYFSSINSRDLKTTRRYKKKLFRGLALTRVQLEKKKYVWIRGGRRKFQNRGRSSSFDKRTAFSKLSRKNYILDKEQHFLVNRLFTVDPYTRIKLLNKLLLWYRLLGLIRIPRPKKKVKMDNYYKLGKRWSKKAHQKRNKYTSSYNNKRNTKRRRVIRKKNFRKKEKIIKKKMQRLHYDKSKQINYCFNKLRRYLKRFISANIQIAANVAKATAALQWLNDLRLYSFAAASWLVVTDLKTPRNRKRKGKKVKDKRRRWLKARLRRLKILLPSKFRNAAVHRRIITEFLPYVKLKKKKKKLKVEPFSVSVTRTIRAIQKERKRRALAGGMSEKQYSLKIKAEEKEAELFDFPSRKKRPLKKW